MAAAIYKNLRHNAFKILCPEELVSNILGHGGRRKDSIQEETGCRIVFSARDVYYPGTKFRVMIIFHDEMEGLVAGLGQIVDRLADCGEKELMHKGKDSELCGRKPGEFILRAAVTPKMSSTIIGVRGCKSKMLESKYRCRINIDQEVFKNHQQLRITALADDLRPLVGAIAEVVNEDAGQADFKAWAMLTSCEDEGADRRGGQRDRDDHRGRDREETRPRSGRDDYRRDDDRRRDDYRDRRPRSPDRNRERERSRRRSEGREKGWGNEEQFWGASAQRKDADASERGAPRDDDPEMDRMLMSIILDAAQSLPESVLNSMHPVTCDLPTEKVSALVEYDGPRMEGVRQSTETEIQISEVEGSEGQQQTLTLQGHLIDVYRAHASMMRMYHDTEPPMDEMYAQEELTEPQEQPADDYLHQEQSGEQENYDNYNQTQQPPVGENPSPEELRAQLEALEKQLEMVRKMKSVQPQGGGGGKGKSR